MRATTLTLAAAILFGFSSVVYGQQQIRHFSAVMSNPMTAMMGEPAAPLHIYVDGSKQRINNPLPGSKDEGDTLILFDKHEQFVIDPYKHTCQESVFPASAASDLSFASLFGPVPQASSTTKIVHLGRGMVAGVMCDIEEIRSAGQPPVKVWLHPGFDIPLKVEMPNAALAQALQGPSQGQSNKIDATYTNGVKAHFKPQEEVAFSFLQSISTLEQACGNTLKRACTLPEMIKMVVAPAPDAPGGKAYLGLSRDPRKDPNYTYAVMVSGKRWIAKATPRRAGLGGFD